MVKKIVSLSREGTTAYLRSPMGRWVRYEPIRPARLLISLSNLHVLRPETMFYGINRSGVVNSGVR